MTCGESAPFLYEKSAVKGLMEAESQQGERPVMRSAGGNAALGKTTFIHTPLVKHDRRNQTRISNGNV